MQRNLSISDVNKPEILVKEEENWLDLNTK